MLWLAAASDLAGIFREARPTPIPARIQSLGGANKAPPYRSLVPKSANRQTIYGLLLWNPVKFAPTGLFGCSLMLLSYAPMICSIGRYTQPIASVVVHRLSVLLKLELSARDDRIYARARVLVHHDRVCARAEHWSFLCRDRYTVDHWVESNFGNRFLI